MKLRLGAATLNQTPLDWKGNLDNIKKALKTARAEKVDLLCLQELVISSYGCQDMFFAPWVAETAAQKVIELLPETKDIATIFGIPYAFEGKLYNCVVFVENGNILGVYAKQSLPGDGIYYEPRWFEPWTPGRNVTIDFYGHSVNLGDKLFDFHGLKVGFEICEDAWREQRPACSYVEQGVDIVLNPSASHYEFRKVEKREELIKSSSKQFNCTYIYANQLGNEAGRMIYEGDLLIASKGNILKRGQHLLFGDMNMIVHDVDFQAQNTIAGPSEDPGVMEEFTQAASLALFDYLRKSHSRGYTISLSGGADSGVCATLVREMVRRGVQSLGEELFAEKLGIAADQEGALVNSILCCVYQGTQNSSDITRNAASELAGELGADYHTWDIDEEIKLARQKVEKSTGKVLTWEKDDLTLQNIQARMRSPLVWMLANTKNHLLITTSNRSEGDVGYATMDGDTSGGLAPLADLDKVFVRKWMQWAHDELGYKSLKFIIDQQPTAELRPLDQGQTDEKDLMPYELLLEIEKLAVWKKNSPAEVYSALKEQHENQEELKQNIIRFFRGWAVSQWKRERLAPSFHFDHFNIDPKTWLRFPILNSGFADEIEELSKK